MGGKSESENDRKAGAMQSQNDRKAGTIGKTKLPEWRSTQIQYAIRTKNLSRQKSNNLDFA
jgi:hypothetical protein